nr:TPA_asm: penton-2 [Rhodactis coral adintovirus]
MTNSFYIVLTSDASRDQYPENKAADFKMQLPNQLHLSEDWELAMTHIIYPYTWKNVQDRQLSYTLHCKNGNIPWSLSIHLPSGIYRTVNDVIHGMLTGLHNALKEIYRKSDGTVTSLRGNDCFYIHEKAREYFELNLPSGWSVTLPKNLARSLGYLNYNNTLPALYQIKTPPLIELNDDHSVTLLATTTIMSRKDDLVWGMLSPHAFQTMYVYSDLVESQVVGDAQANVLRILVPRGQPGDLVAEEIKLPSYHRLRTSVFSSVAINIRGDTGDLIPFASGNVRVTLHFRRRGLL